MPDPAPLRVVVMARHPVPGRVKTRLAARIGDVAAAALQTAFIVDLAARLATTGLRVTWAVEPPGAPFTTLVPGARVTWQAAGDLGARMVAALASQWAEAPGPVAVLGSDVPHLPLVRLEETRAALGSGAEVVLGPAEDGGYYLVAMAQPAPALFAGVPWGTPGVLGATLGRAADAGLRVAQLAPETDVDTWDDLHVLRARCATVDDLPRTRAVLATLFAGPAV